MALQHPMKAFIIAGLLATSAAAGLSAYFLIPRQTLNNLVAATHRTERDDRLYNAYVLGQVLAKISFLKLIQNSGRADLMNPRELKALIDGLSVKAHGRAQSLGANLDVAALDLMPPDPDHIQTTPGLATADAAIARAQGKDEATAFMLGARESIYYHLAAADHLPPSNHPLGLRGQIGDEFAEGQQIGFPELELPSDDAATVKARLVEYDRAVFHRFGG